MVLRRTQRSESRWTPCRCQTDRQTAVCRGPRSPGSEGPGLPCSISEPLAPSDAHYVTVAAFSMGRVRQHPLREDGLGGGTLRWAQETKRLSCWESCVCSQAHVRHSTAPCGCHHPASSTDTPLASLSLPPGRPPAREGSAQSRTGWPLAGTHTSWGPTRLPSHGPHGSPHSPPPHTPAAP